MNEILYKDSLAYTDYTHGDNVMLATAKINRHTLG